MAASKMAITMNEFQFGAISGHWRVANDAKTHTAGLFFPFIGEIYS
jgi:hypothetical protein